MKKKSVGSSGSPSRDDLIKKQLDDVKKNLQQKYKETASLNEFPSPSASRSSPGDTFVQSCVTIANRIHRTINLTLIPTE